MSLKAMKAIEKLDVKRKKQIGKIVIRGRLPEKNNNINLKMFHF